MRQECARRYRFAYVDPTCTVSLGTVLTDRDSIPFWRVMARTMDHDRFGQFTIRCSGDILPIVERCLSIFEYYNRAQGTVSTLAIDEYGALDRAKSRPLYRASAQGRHIGVSLLLASQRAVDLTPALRANLEELRVFRTVERIDLDRLSKISTPLAEASSLRGHESLSFCFLTGAITRNS
jgi:hypothetical protein